MDQKAPELVPFPIYPLMLSGEEQDGESIFFTGFLRFNVAQGRGVYFFSPDAGVQNILARVTGNTRSEIQGTIGTYGNSIPNLFLINPNGIIFSRTASLDMGNAGLAVGGSGGSFIATTANAVLLGNSGIFSASEPTRSNLLDVKPSALLFNAIAAQEIVNQSQATQSVLGFSINGLQVPNGRSLLLVGGDVRLDGGTMRASGGQVELGGLAAPGQIGLSLEGNMLRLTFPNDLPRSDVFLRNNSKIAVPAGNGGSVTINARNIEISGSSRICAGIGAASTCGAASNPAFGSPNSQAGDITLNATEAVRIAQSSQVENDVSRNATGNSGNLNITANTLLVTDGSRLSASTFGRGNAGNILMQITGAALFSGSSTIIFTNVARNAVGNGGNITLYAGSVSVTDGAQLNSLTRGRGDAGNVTIQADSAVVVDGVGSSNGFPSGAFSNVEAGAIGNGGSINITADSLFLTNGGQLGALVRGATDGLPSGRGNGGTVNINVQDAVTIAGTSADGTQSGIFSSLGSGAVGSGGGINITAGSLAITDDARLSVSTFGRGNAGNILMQIAGAAVFRGDETLVVSNVGTDAIGNAGSIRLNANSVAVLEGAQLNSFTRGRGDAGNVTIQADGAVMFDGVGNSDDFPSAVLSNVEAGAIGNGGSVNITAGSLFLTNGGQLGAIVRGATDGLPGGRGNGGRINVNVRDAVTIAGTIADGTESGIFSSLGFGAVGSGGDSEHHSRDTCHHR
ncbi:filamentous hemagglutinin N-terminal domain-containing protein [Kovacikia minuta CCNUW1]|uniref:two-partner secretion domain-containing protein n=1 Tax=Kovacikia minuta TaxID=2931930 RepID=UPI001CCA5519|nr:filamentous hemagglutinin N-terminal domain-containing protein [Kovacikia minuta]UBF25610.1 filamentous hemagglutinin N-terminal domain-containing protein [Kovacikia minuta CCNUW1]